MNSLLDLAFIKNETERIYDIVKLKDLFRLRGNLFHQRYEGTPKIECTISEVVWAHIKYPRLAYKVVESLEKIIPDIRDQNEEEDDEPVEINDEINVDKLGEDDASDSDDMPPLVEDPRIFFKKSHTKNHVHQLLLPFVDSDSDDDASPPPPLEQAPLEQAPLVEAPLVEAP